MNKQYKNKKDKPALSLWDLIFQWAPIEEEGANYLEEGQAGENFSDWYQNIWLPNQDPPRPKPWKVKNEPDSMY